MNVSTIVREAMDANLEAFSQTVQDSARLLRRETGTVGNLTVTGRLVEIKPCGEALVVGDLHGDLESLIDILQQSNFLNKMTDDNDAIAIFLGDYGDRGEYSKEIYYTLLKLKLTFPKQVIMMRGNHEGPEDLMPSPHDMPLEFQAKFGETWRTAYSRIRELFAYLHTAVLVKDRCLMIHGGLPLEANSLEDLAFAHKTYPTQGFLEDMLWSDPSEEAVGLQSSPRGAGRLFGKDATETFLRRFGLNVLIRGHEPCEEGFRISHGGRILTLFSRKGQPYFNAHGAYLDFDLATKIDDAEELVPYIHKL